MKKFLIDENLPKTLKLQTNDKFIHVCNLDKQMTDSEIWEYAKQNDCIIITKDTDFFERIILLGTPPKIIWIRLGNIRRRQLEQNIVNKWDEIIQKIDEYDLLEIHNTKIEGLKF